MTFDARAVANQLLDFSDTHGIDVGTLSLQKILYYCHGWWLLEKGNPLISQSFEAWDHGPVVRLVYDALKEIPKYQPIRSRISFLNFNSGEIEEPRPDLGNHGMTFLDEVFRYYARIRVYDLVEMTHAPESPWDEVYFEKIVSPGMQISNDRILSHFQSFREFRFQH